MQLTKLITYTGTITTITGLHIGAGNDTIEIGGVDNPILKHPITHMPYIPGSSLKGKLRSLLEITRQEIEGYPKPLPTSEKGNPCACGKCYVCLLFGQHLAGKSKEDKESDKEPQPIPRLLVRDCTLNGDTLQSNFTLETKYETAIDRVKGTAKDGSLRSSERVPSGTNFDSSLVLKIFEGDNEKALMQALNFAFKVLEIDALGGYGSRGSGQVKVAYTTSETELKELLAQVPA